MGNLATVENIMALHRNSVGTLWESHRHLMLWNDSMSTVGIFCHDNLYGPYELNLSILLSFHIVI